MTLPDEEYRGRGGQAVIAMEFQFTAGQYHATPWGRHVNEGDVEWPPSPWRVLRALIATWYRKTDTQAYSENALASLVEAMAERLPVYRLPPAVHTHTRHYMPIKSGTTLVHDAFARISSQDRLFIAWPGLELSEEQMELCSFLTARISYLGRAESWVSTRLIRDWTGEANAYPVAGIAMADEPAVETGFQTSVSLLSPIGSDEFADWRKHQPRTKGKRDWMPDTLLEALSVSTGDLEKSRWSAPPGSRTVLYLRPENSLDSYHPTPIRGTSQQSYNVARFALGGNAKLWPRWTDAVKMGDVLHLALMSGGDDDVSPAISGRDAMGGILRANHRHGYCLPEDADGDGYIDHLLFVSQDPFSESVLNSIVELNDKQKLWTPDHWSGRSGKWLIRLEMLGNTEDHSSLRSSDGEVNPILAQARVWTSITPYFHPWHAKKHGRFGAAEQIRREIAQRGLPDPTSIRICGATNGNVESRKMTPQGTPFEARDFRRRRPSHPGQSAPDKHGHFLRLEFSERVSGPLAFGFANHFGLGLFAPDFTSPY